MNQTDKTHTFGELQRLCLKNASHLDINCSGQGVTREYLFSKLSEAGLLGEKETSPVDSLSARHTSSFLTRLTEDEKKKLYIRYGVESIEDLSVSLVDTPAVLLTNQCTSVPFLCTDELFKVLFHDVYPDVYDVIASVEVTEKMKDFHDDYRPLAVSKGVYGFWELLYSEMDVIVGSKETKEALEGVINEEETPSLKKLLRFAITSLFLGQLYESFTITIVEHDDKIYGYLEIDTEEALGYLYSNSPGVVSSILGRPDIDPTAGNNYVIRWASENGYTETVRLLLAWEGPNDERVDPTVDYNYVVQMISKHGDTETVKLLLAWRGPNDERVDPTAGNNYVVQMISKHGDMDTVKFLLDWRGPNDKRVNPTANNNYAIRWASRNGHADTVRLLLAWRSPMAGDERVDPTVNDNYAIRWASKYGYVDTVRLLLAWKGLNGKRVDPTSNRNYAIRLASKNGDADTVRLLLAWRGPGGERVNPTSSSNYAISWALENGHRETVKLLLAWRGPGDERVDPAMNRNM